MSYALSFSTDFLVGDDPEIQPSLLPTSVLQAIFSLSEQERQQLAHEVFGMSPEFLSTEIILDRVIATNTCENLDSPVRVWIDDAGLHTLLIHDDEHNEDLWFIEDGPGGAITALLPSDY